MRAMIAVAGLVTLGACSQPADTPANKTAADGKWNAEDACSLLDKRNVGAALGTEIVTTELATVVQRGDASAGFSTCFYKLADGQQVAFLARQSPSADNTPEAMQRTRDETAALVGPVTAVSGDGKGAFWVPNLRQLIVFLGDDRYFNLTMPANLDNKDPKTIALGLATRIE